MPKYASLRRIRLTRDGYIMKGDLFAHEYRGVGSVAMPYLYRVECYEAGDLNRPWQEFRCVNRAEAVIEARKWLSTYNPGWDVRS